MGRLLGFLTVALLVAGCGGPNVSSSDVEQTIRAQVEKDAGLKVKVRCPDPIDWHTGGQFHCIATAPPGSGYRKTLITVSMENDAGAYTWRGE